MRNRDFPLRNHILVVIIAVKIAIAIVGHFVQLV
jgi:hypothetical protein